MIDKNSFIKEYGLQKLWQAANIEWEVLETIYNDYLSKKPSLDETAKELARLFSEQPIYGKHSVSFRVKDENHLIAKIIRNSAGESANKYRFIDADNYYKIVTDFIGVRILVLDKENWEKIHECIIDQFPKNKKEYYINIYDRNYNYVNDESLKTLVEEPKAYVRYGDPDIFGGKIKPNYTHKNYRSQHYVVKYQNVYCEIQVRSLAEEVYGEFDHAIRYPLKVDNKFLKRYTSMLSKLTRTADDMLSLLLKFPSDVIEQCDTYFEEEQFPRLEEVEAEDQMDIDEGLHNLIEKSGGNILAFGLNKSMRK